MEKSSVAIAHLYLLLDRDEMSNLYRGHSIDASYHLAKRFQRFLEIDKSETRIACGQTLLPQAILVLDWSISVLRFLEAE
jgi:hypothetical protein